jgi:hypothetical protein
MSARHHARGGNSPFVVLGDADVDLAVRAAVFGRFLHQGQICMSINGIIVDDSLHDAFAERFVEHVRGLERGVRFAQAVEAGMTRQRHVVGRRVDYRCIHFHALDFGAAYAACLSVMNAGQGQPMPLL